MSKEVFKIDETDSNIRIDSYLSDIYKEYSRSKIQELIKQAKVLVNGESCKPAYIVRVDDEIVCDTESLSVKILPEDIDLDIVYENEYFGIVNKPSGMLTHPTSKITTSTLVNALLYRYGNNLSDINGDYRKGIVHRLDKNTSGLLIFAKTNEAHEKLASMIKNREIEKHYLAVVRGRLENDIVISEPIGRSKTNPSKMCVTKDGKPSLSEVKIIKQFKDATYVDVNLKTGRTHQIRVHLSHIGHPVYNDTLYGFGKMKIKTDEQVLQAYKLKFNNPFNDEIIDIEIKPDEKIDKVLLYLTNFS